MKETALTLQGKIEVSVFDAEGNIKSYQEESNDVLDTAIIKLGGALISADYDLEGEADKNNVFSLRSAVAFTSTASTVSANLGGDSDHTANDDSAADWMARGCIVVYDDASDTALMAFSTTPSIGSDNVSIELVGTVTGVNCTWATAKMGALREYLSTGAGTPTWCTQWADGNFDDVAVGVADTLQINWTLSLAST